MDCRHAQRFTLCLPFGCCPLRMALVRRVLTVAQKNTETKSKRGTNPASLANLAKATGRPKGVPNKATCELKALARTYTPEAIQTYVEIMRSGESESARVTAASAILDRGYGKPVQAVGDQDGNALDWVALLAAARGRV